MLDARGDQGLELLVDVGVDRGGGCRREAKEPSKAGHVRSAPLGLEHARQRIEVIDEAVRLGAEVIATGRREAVVPCAATVLRDAPFGDDELSLLHAMERLEQGSVVDEDATSGPRFE